MVNRLLNDCLPGEWQQSPPETANTTTLHIEVGPYLKTDLDRAHRPLWREVLELMRKRGPIGRVTVGWQRKPRMQVAADSHNFCLGTQVMPLLPCHLTDGFADS
jgi:hypothetical protein